MGKLYGIGVGPGDAELLTIKGKRIINQVDYLFCPITKENSESFAYEIIKTHIENENLQIINLLYPMHYDLNQLENQWSINAEIIQQYLKGDKTGAFVVLGDASIYSTFMYTMPYLNSDLVEVEVVPGITSFSAISSRLRMPLVEWEENLMIAPVRKNDKESLEQLFESSDNLVLMKPSNHIEAIKELIKERHLENDFTCISYVGTEKEQIIQDIEQLSQIELPYLSTFIIKNCKKNQNI